MVAANGTELPSFEAGAHIDVHLKNGLTRQYSLSNCCTEKHRYVIGVLHDANSRGGSRCIHTEYREGDLLKIGEPRNLFEIHPHTKQAVLFAGGIGITLFCRWRIGLSRPIFLLNCTTSFVVMK